MDNSLRVVALISRSCFVERVRFSAGRKAQQRAVRKLVGGVEEFFRAAQDDNTDCHRRWIVFYSLSFLDRVHVVKRFGSGERPVSLSSVGPHRLGPCVTGCLRLLKRNVRFAEPATTSNVPHA